MLNRHRPTHKHTWTRSHISSNKNYISPEFLFFILPTLPTQFLAHLSQRLTGELIGYPCTGVHPSVVCLQFQMSSPWPIKAKFSVEPPWIEGKKVCSRHLGRMTKMTATPIYGKNSSKIFSFRTGGPIFTKLGM